MTAVLLAESEPEVQLHRPDFVLWVGRALLVVSLIVWIAVLPGLADAHAAEFGLLQANGPGFLAAAVGIAVAFGLALRAGSVPDCAAAVIALTVVNRATPALIDPLPIYDWTYKHIGVADYLNSTGHLARGVDIYNSWPGFFSLAAWLNNLSGLSLEDIARWFPFAIDLAMAAGMYAISRAYGQSARVAVAAAFGMQVFNWVGQDYFSPQALAFALALPTIALLVRSRRQPREAWLSVVLVLAITVTHQLTPFWLCGIAVLLALSHRIRPRSVAVIFVLIAVGYAALNYSSIAQYGLFTGLDPLSNAQSNTASIAGTAASRLVSNLGKAVSLLMWLGAALCALLARRRGDRVWTRLVVAFTAFALLAGENYGGEAIFRVLMYSVPGCMVLIAPEVERLIRRTAQPRKHVLLAGTGRLILAIAAVGAVVGSMQAYYGPWFNNVVSRQDLTTVTQILATASPNSLVTPLIEGSPARPTGDYVRFARVQPGYDEPLIVYPDVLGSSFGQRAVTHITDQLASANAPVYLIITEQMRRYNDYYGLFPPGAISRLIANLSGSSRWTTLLATPTMSVFRLASS